MSDDVTFHSEALDDSTPTSAYTNDASDDAPRGCAYLQAIRGQLESYQTTGGEYLDAIFTHREVFNAYPPGHRSCARAFSDIAYLMEQRAWRADRDEDAEAVIAFRHEAWKIAASFV